MASIGRVEVKQQKPVKAEKPGEIKNEIEIGGLANEISAEKKKLEAIATKEGKTLKPSTIVYKIENY